MERSISTRRRRPPGALFDQLDIDHDGTVDRKELGDRISAADWKIADPDNDKTISKDEYLAFVEVAFKRANPDNDATIDAKELKTPAGHALLRLLDEVSGRASPLRLFRVRQAPPSRLRALCAGLKRMA